MHSVGLPLRGNSPWLIGRLSLYRADRETGISVGNCLLGSLFIKLAGRLELGFFLGNINFDRVFLYTR